MKSRKIKNISTRVIFWTSSALLIFVLFVFLQPKIASSLFYERRVDQLSNIITLIKDTKTVNAREFWEFREFYMPGVAEFKKDGLTAESLPTSLLTLFPENVTPYLFFTSKKMRSVDGLGTQESFNQIKKSLMSRDEAKIVSMSDSYILVSIENSYYLSFIKSQDELSDTTGIFQYWAIQSGQSDMNWINLTEIES